MYQEQESKHKFHNFICRKCHKNDEIPPGVRQMGSFPCVTSGPTRLKITNIQEKLQWCGYGIVQNLDPGLCTSNERKIFDILLKEYSR